jgi:hypothetical protein
VLDAAEVARRRALEYDDGDDTGGSWEDMMGGRRWRGGEGAMEEDEDDEEAGWVDVEMACDEVTQSMPVTASARRTAVAREGRKEVSHHSLFLQLRLNAFSAADEKSRKPSATRQDPRRNELGVQRAPLHPRRGESVPIAASNPSNGVVEDLPVLSLRESPRSVGVSLGELVPSRTLGAVGALGVPRHLHPSDDDGSRDAVPIRQGRLAGR